MIKRYYGTLLLMGLGASALTAGVLLWGLRSLPADQAPALEGLLTRLLWLLPVLAAGAAIPAWRERRRLREKVRALAGETPDCSGGSGELEPLAARLREQNLTIRRQSEALGRKRRDFDAITENMREGFLLLDRRLNVLSRNESARILLTGDADAAGNLNRPGCPEEVRRAAEKALAGERTQRSLRLEEHTYLLIASPIAASGQAAGAVVIAMDVTEREERETLRREFSANVSHELKTPLTSITGFAELLKDGLVPPERVSEFAGDIYRESRRLIRLVDDIIELSRLEEEGSPPYAREPADLYGIARDALEALRPAAEARGISLQLRGAPAAVSGVGPILREMVYNLCDNAVKYNRENGSVTVTVQPGPEPRVTVEDTGIGIPYAHQSRVFERFYRVDKSHSRRIGGTGLGMSIVKHGARIHNARLELWSEPDRGTRITITFGKENL